MRDDELDEDGDEKKAEHLRDVLTDDFDVAFRKATTLEKLLLLEHENGTDEARCGELLATLEAPFELALLAAIIPWHQPVCLEVCTRFVERHPSIALAHALLVEAYERLDDREAARRAAERGRAQAERPAYLHAAAAAHLANEGRYRDALAEIDEARADDPEWLGSELLGCVLRAELGDREPLAAWIAGMGELDVLKAHHAVSLLREHGLGDQAVQVHLASPLSFRRDEHQGRESVEETRETFGLWVSPFPPAWREHWQREEERFASINALRAAMHLFDVRARLADEEARQGRPETAEDLLPRVDATCNTTVVRK